MALIYPGAWYGIPWSSGPSLGTLFIFLFHKRTMSYMEQLWYVFLVNCVVKDENRKILMKDLNTVNCNSFHFLIIRFVLIRVLFFTDGCFLEKKHWCHMRLPELKKKRHELGPSLYWCTKGWPSRRDRYSWPCFPVLVKRHPCKWSKSNTLHETRSLINVTQKLVELGELLSS